MDRVYPLTVSIPAGTLQSAPLDTPWALEDNYLVTIDVIVPDGPVGLMGFRILQAKQQVFPWANSYYLAINNEHFEIPWNDQITSTGLVIEAYNIGVYTHNIYFRAHIRNLDLSSLQQITATESSISTSVSSETIPVSSVITNVAPSEILPTVATVQADIAQTIQETSQAPLIEPATAQTGVAQPVANIGDLTAVPLSTVSVTPELTTANTLVASALAGA